MNDLFDYFFAIAITLLAIIPAFVDIKNANLSFKGLYGLLILVSIIGFYHPLNQAEISLNLANESSKDAKKEIKEEAKQTRNIMLDIYRGSILLLPSDFQIGILSTTTFPATESDLKGKPSIFAEGKLGDSYFTFELVESAPPHHHDKTSDGVIYTHFYVSRNIFFDDLDKYKYLDELENIPL